MFFSPKGMFSPVPQARCCVGGSRKSAMLCQASLVTSEPGSFGKRKEQRMRSSIEGVITSFFLFLFFCPGDLIVVFVFLFGVSLYWVFS